MSRNRILGVPQNTALLPSAAGSVYNETFQDDLIAVPQNAAAGAPYCTVNLNGAFNPGGQPADGDWIEFCDPFGVLGAGTPLVIVGKSGANGFPILEGGPAQNNVILNTPGARREYMFSGPLSAWVRRGDAPSGVSQVYLTQAAWFIDPANSTGVASDANPGTAPLPLLTYGELYRRVMGLGTNVFLPQSTTVTWLSTPPVTDAASQIINVNIGLPAGVQVTFVAPPATLIRAGSFTAVVGINAATNTPQQVTDGGIANWAADVGRRVRNTTAGARLNSVSWVAKDLGAGAARMAPFVSFNANPSLAPSQQAPLVGDTYVVETMPAVAIGSINVGAADIQQAATFAQGSVVFQNFDFNNGGLGALGSTMADFVNIIAQSCKIPLFLIPPSLARWLIDGCLLSTVVTDGVGNGSGTQIRAGLTRAGFLNITNGLIAYSVDHLTQGTQWAVISSLARAQFNGAGFFDGAGLGAVRLFRGGTAETTGTLYGSGGANFGIDIETGATMQTDTGHVPTLTGTGGDWTFDQNNFTARAFDDTQGAGATFTAGRATTWALFTTAVGAGGFGNFAQCVETGSRLTMQQ